MEVQKASQLNVDTVRNRQLWISDVCDIMGQGAFIDWAVRSLQYKKYDTRVTLVENELKQLIMDTTLCERCVYCLY